ncbi:MAG: hypothetical protein IPO09_09945 [Anaeromyxobacter sp.]|nr:hypothetical protein [Anaeromyxobacter sp.]MBL0278566.1 hypothetical protein [Anaeromyxobacter sp.]
MRALAAALAVTLWPVARAQEPAEAPRPAPVLAPPPSQQDLPAPARSTAWRASLTAAGGWESARLQEVPFSGPAIEVGVLLAPRELPGDGFRVRIGFHLAGRVAETPQGLAGYQGRMGTLLGVEHGRFGLAAGLDWVWVDVRRATSGSMRAYDLALHAAGTVELVRLDGGALFAEVAGSAANATRQDTLALLLGWRFHLN